MDERTKVAQPLAQGLPEELLGCSAQEIADQRRLAREIKRQVEARAQIAKAMKRASVHPLPFE